MSIARAGMHLERGLTGRALRRSAVYLVEEMAGPGVRLIVTAVPDAVVPSLTVGLRWGSGPSSWRTAWWFPLKPRQEQVQAARSGRLRAFEALLGRAQEPDHRSGRCRAGLGRRAVAARLPRRGRPPLRPDRTQPGRCPSRRRNRPSTPLAHLAWASSPEALLRQSRSG